jgi:cytochrome P450
MAGHHTSTIALTWTWYLLSQHPAAEAKLHAELANLLGGRTPQYEDLPRLRYTRMVIEESMRLYPPTPILEPRQAIRADEILGVRVPAGATILIAPWLLHRRKSMWQNPELFDPERFAPDQSAARQRFSYIPFGIGPHTCIGMSFAMNEMMLFLATVAQRYRLHLQLNHPVEPYGFIILNPRYGMPMTIERRR